VWEDQCIENLMQKILITGFSGFVSSHLLQYLSRTGTGFEIIGISRNNFTPGPYKNLQIKGYKADLKNTELARQIIQTEKPEAIIHLASESSVAYSWQQPVSSFQNNTNIFLNLVETVRHLKLPCRILSVGSSEEYGIFAPGTLPLTEEHELNPISPYAVARVSQEMLSKIYAQGYGLDIIMTRSFNHIGPGQKDNFVVSSFAEQIVKIKKGVSAVFETGNVDIVRDFLDVRDVVIAYMQLLEHGRRGEIYNVCSGVGYSLKEIIIKMMQIAGISFDYTVNPALIRPSDNPVIVGDNTKILNECNWQPVIAIEKSLRDILAYWEQKLN